VQIAILLYDRFTALDAVGPYEVLSRLNGAEVIFTAEQAGPVRADTGMLTMTADAALDDVPHPDIVLVPGGPGQEEQMGDGPVHDWLRRADAASSWTTSVCTGSLVLAAAGLLDGRRATSHWLALDRLRPLGARPVSERVVIDGKYVTAAGVSAGIDMALGLSGRIAGTPAAQAIQLMIEYDPRPPLTAGSPATAPRDLVTTMRMRSRHTRLSRAAQASRTASA
jgi:putative intracellular protease/amidase